MKSPKRNSLPIFNALSAKSFTVGDRVKVKAGKNHDEMTKDKTGTVEEVSSAALAIKFDGMDKVHKWYVADELDAAGAKKDSAKAFANPLNRITERVSFTNKDGHAEIYLYDEIGGWGITAKNFAEQLKQLGDVSQITLHINSPGGDVFDGAAIFNLLAKHKAEVTVEVDGMALSAASVVMCAGDSIKMAANAMVMIHDPWTIAMGSADDMRKAAELLDKVKQTIVDVYVARTSNKADQVTQWMAEETWFSADEAKANKFADEITPNKSVAASLKPDDVRSAWKSAKDDPRKLRDLLCDMPATGPQNREDDDPDRPNPKPPKEPNAHGDADSDSDEGNVGTGEEDTENNSDAWRVKLARRRQQLAALRA